MRLLKAHGSVKLSEVTSDFATQSLWLRNGKVRSQVSSIDRSRFLARTVGEIRREEDEPATERRRERTDLGERKEQVVCHASALAMTDEARREAEM